MIGYHQCCVCLRWWWLWNDWISSVLCLFEMVMTVEWLDIISAVSVWDGDDCGMIIVSALSAWDGDNWSGNDWVSSVLCLFEVVIDCPCMEYCTIKPTIHLRWPSLLRTCSDGLWICWCSISSGDLTNSDGLWIWWHWSIAWRDLTNFNGLWFGW